MKITIKILFIFLLFSKHVYANDTTNWLKSEIDVILNAYKNDNLSPKDRFLLIEETINANFAGAGIAKFVSSDSWLKADKKTKKIYIKHFKRHLALNIASMMQGYSSQEYKLINNKYDQKNKVTLIDMEISNGNNNLLVTWRVKKSKDKFYVIDLIVADISLVVTKRSEFNSILSTINYDLESLSEILKLQNESSYKKIIN